MSKINNKMKPATANVVQNQNTVDLAVYRDSTNFDKVRRNALKQYQIGRYATYEAIALTYIWYQLSKQDSSYLDSAFKPFSNQSNSHVFTKAVKVCLKMDQNTQAPTISKYKNVLLFIENKYSNKVIENDSDALVTDIVNIIKYQGGLDACAKAKNSTNKNKSNTLTKEQIERRVQKYKDKTTQVLSSFNVPANFNISPGNLVLMLARSDGSNFEIVDVLANDNLVKYVIRNK